MPAYRIALFPGQLDSAPVVVASGPAVAAAQYVKDNKLRAARYFVREVPEPDEVEVTIKNEVEAKLIHKGGQPATITEEVTPNAIP